MLTWYITSLDHVVLKSGSKQHFVLNSLNSFLFSSEDRKLDLYMPAPLNKGLKVQKSTHGIVSNDIKASLTLLDNPKPQTELKQQLPRRLRTKSRCRVKELLNTILRFRNFA